MTIRHLKTFIKVCECDYSISKASQDLCVAQPSVSQTIKELENYYGVILFDRVNRRLVLTEEGEILLAKAKEVTGRFDEFETLANKKDLNPIVKIGATVTFGAFVIPRFKQLLKEKIPNITPHFVVDKPESVESKVLIGELDFGFEEGIIKDKNINAVCIGEDELVAVCSNTYNAPEKIKLVDLINHPLLVREKGNPSRRILDYQLAIKGLKIHMPLLESVSNNCILSMILTNEGIGIVSAAIAKKWQRNNPVKILDLDTPLKRKLFLVTNKNKVMNASVSKTYALAKEILPIARKEREEHEKKQK